MYSLHLHLGKIQAISGASSFTFIFDAMQREKGILLILLLLHLPSLAHALMQKIHKRSVLHYNIIIGSGDISILTGEVWMKTC